MKTTTCLSFTNQIERDVFAMFCDVISHLGEGGGFDEEEEEEEDERKGEELSSRYLFYHPSPLSFF